MDETIEMLIAIGTKGARLMKLMGDKNYISIVQVIAIKNLCTNEVNEGEQKINMILGEKREEANLIQNKLKVHSILKVKATIDEEGKIQVKEVLSSDLRDNDLELIIEKDKEPKNIKDEILGELLLDKSTMHFKTKIVFNDNKIDIDIFTRDGIFAKEQRDLAVEIVKKFEDISKKIFEYLADKLIELKNDEWRTESEKILTKEEFIAKLTVEDISISLRPSATFYIDCQDLFGGHSINVTMSKDGSFSREGIVG